MATNQKAIAKVAEELVVSPDVATRFLERVAYEVQITDEGPAGRSFSWQVLRRHDRSLVARSARGFATRGEAIADAAEADIWRTSTPSN